MNRITSLQNGPEAAGGQVAIVSIDTPTTARQLAYDFLVDANYDSGIENLNGLDPGQVIPPGETVALPTIWLQSDVLASLLKGGTGKAEKASKLALIGVGVVALAGLLLVDRK